MAQRWVLVIAAVAAAAACSGSVADPVVDEITQASPTVIGANVSSNVIERGGQLYAQNCQMCHGADAKGTGPVLNKMRDDYGYQTIVDPNLTNRPAALIEIRLEATSRPLGPTSVMPPFGKLLSSEERAAIAQYISSLPE